MPIAVEGQVQFIFIRSDPEVLPAVWKGNPGRWSTLTDLNQHWKEEDPDELHGRTTRQKTPNHPVADSRQVSQYGLHASKCQSGFNGEEGNIL